MTDKQYASISSEDGFLLLQKWHDEKRLVRCVAILAPAIEMGAIMGRIEQLSRESAYVSAQSFCPDALEGNSCFLRIPQCTTKTFSRRSSRLNPADFSPNGSRLSNSLSYGKLRTPEPAGVCRPPAYRPRINRWVALNFRTGCRAWTEAANPSLSARCDIPVAAGVTRFPKRPQVPPAPASASGVGGVGLRVRGRHRAPRL